MEMREGRIWNFEAKLVIGLEEEGGLDRWPQVFEG